MTPTITPTTVIGRIRDAVMNYARQTYSARFGTPPPANMFDDINPALINLAQADYDIVVSEMADILSSLGFMAHLQPDSLKHNGNWSDLCVDLKGSID